MANVCPLEPVHRRLNDAHDLLHKLEESYFDPVGFRQTLNLLLQTLRNVTWILQNNKSVVPGFDEWYASWQALMRADAILRWSVESRNYVVKQGDLETHSRARIAIVDTYLTPRSAEVDVNPSSSAEEIAIEASKQLDIPEKDRAITVIRVERRWVDSNLRDHELLDALHYVLLCLAEVLDSAHEQLRPNESGKRAAPALPQYTAASEDVRTAYFKLKDQTFVSHGSQPMRSTEEGRRAAAERYGINFDAMSKPQTFEDVARQNFDIARAVLLRDGHHKTFALLIGPEGIKLVGILADDKAEKFLIWRRIAEQVREMGATSIIVVGEMWQAMVEGPITVHNVEDLDNKQEILSLQAASADGEFIVLQAEFHHAPDGSITLGETTQLKTTQAYPGYLTPILQVWGASRKNPSP